MLGGYYRFYPGDYLRDTSGLSLIEHGAYFLLLNNYYSQEGLINEKPRLYRLCGAVTPEEQAAVDYVVTSFFPLVNGKLTNKRADIELDDRRQFLEEQKRKGCLGGRPRKNPEESRGLAGAKPGGKPRGKPEETPPAPAPDPEPDPEPKPLPEPKSQKRIVTRPKGNGRFTPPTLDEVIEYCKARDNRVDPIKYHAHYTANGWRVGKNPMKNWKAAVVTWERNTQ